MNLFSSPRLISLALAFFRFVKMFLGLVVLYLSVKYFGTSYERDSWVLSIALYGFIVSSIYSPINDTFRTKYIFLKEQNGEEFAMKSVNSLMNFFNLTYLLVAIVLFIAMSEITRHLAPGFDLSMREYLGKMVLALIPFFILQQQGNTLIGLLNTYDSYFYPELVSLLASIINILFIVFFSDEIGIYSLVLATTLNGLILVTVLSVMLHKRVASFRLISLEKLSLGKSFLMFSLPMYLSAFCVQMYLFVEKSTCTHFGEGAVSVYDYARQLTNLPHIVFSSIVPIVMTPLLSKCFIVGNENGFSDELRRFMRLLLYFTLFIVVLFIVNGNQISYFLFSEKNSDFIHILTYLSGAILCLVFSMICGQSLIARSRVLDYVVAVIAGNVLSVLLCFFVSDRFHMEILALFYLIGQALSAVILLFKIKMNNKILLIKDLGIIVLTGVISFILLSFVQYSLDGTDLLSNDKLYITFDLLLCAVILFFIILSSLLLFGGEERQMILGFLSKLKKKIK